MWCLAGFRLTRIVGTAYLTLCALHCNPYKASGLLFKLHTELYRLFNLSLELWISLQEAEITLIIYKHFHVIVDSLSHHCRWGWVRGSIPYNARCSYDHASLMAWDTPCSIDLEQWMFYWRWAHKSQPQEHPQENCSFCPASQVKVRGTAIFHLTPSSLKKSRLMTTGMALLLHNPISQKLPERGKTAPYPCHGWGRMRLCPLG